MSLNVFLIKIIVMKPTVSYVGKDWAIEVLTSFNDSYAVNVCRLVDGACYFLVISCDSFPHEVDDDYFNWFCHAVCSLGRYNGTSDLYWKGVAL